MSFRYVVADDAAFIRELLKSVMKNEGHLCVGEASDGTEAISAVAQALPDVIFLDIVMPRKTGVQAAREIAEIWPVGKRIACTTLEEEQLKPEDRALFHAFLVKPFTKENLLEAITTALGTSSEVHK